jgi:hypothetical protein
MQEKLPLTEQDINKIRKNLFTVLLFPVLAAGLFYGFFSIFFDDSNFFHDAISRIILIGFSVFFFVIIGYMASVFIIDLRGGYKIRITGTITDKKQQVHTTRSTTTRAGSSRSSTTRHYFVSIDEIQYPIEHENYHKLFVGRQVILEKAPTSNLTLLLEIGENSPILKQPIKLVHTPTKSAFSPEDFAALKRGLKATVKRRLFWLLPPLLITLSLVWNGMQAFLVFLFPIVLIPAYQFWKIIQELKRYQSNKQYAYKEGIPAVIEDKSKYTHNGSISNHVLTSQGTLKMDHKVYEKMKVGDEIILFKPAKGKQILSVLTIDKEEFYLL